MDNQDGGGLRHRLDDQHTRHHGARREMALEIVLVLRQVLDPGRPLVRDHVHDLVDHQKWVPVRYHFHDPRNADLRSLLRRAGRINHDRPFLFARRCSTAVCLMNSLSGTAGLPHTASPAGTSRMRPLLAAILAPLPMCKCPASPPCPPTMT